MNLKLDFNGGQDGFNLTTELDINIKEDAEALGYITSVIFEMSLRLSKLMETANPIYHERISKGVNKSI